MSEALEEIEQIENMKRFWGDNKRWIINMVSVCIIMYAGITYYKHHQEVRKNKAAQSYNSLMLAVSQEDSDSIKLRADEILKHYKDTAYGPFARLMLAKLAVDKSNWDEARLEYEKIIKENKNTELSALARLRLARLLHGPFNDTKAALKLLDEYEDGYAVLFSELKGDIYIDLKEYDKAKASYKDAIAKSKDERSPFLRFKLMSLGEIEKQEENVSDKNA